MGHPVNRLGHGARQAVLDHGADEAAVDLEEVHRQLLETGKRRHAAAEVVQREQAAFPLERLDELRGAAEVCDGRGLGNLETQHVGRHAVLGQQAAHEPGQVLVRKRTARKIDGEDRPLGYGRVALLHGVVTDSGGSAASQEMTWRTTQRSMAGIRL